MSVLFSSQSLPTHHVIPGFRRFSTSKPLIPVARFSKLGSNISSTRFNLRFENVGRSQPRQRLSKLFANPPEGDIVKGKSEESDPQGPPFLTILAGQLRGACIFGLNHAKMTKNVNQAKGVQKSGKNSNLEAVKQDDGQGVMELEGLEQKAKASEANRGSSYELLKIVHW